MKRFRAESRFFTLHYHVPPGKASPLRQGEAKAGNLNSCLKYLRRSIRRWS